MAKKIDLRHADLSDCRSRVSPYFEIGQRIGDLEVVDNIERTHNGKHYRIKVRCVSCGGPSYWCCVSSLLHGRSERCLDCHRTELVLRNQSEPVFVMDCDGDLHNIACVTVKGHELRQIYDRCAGAQQRCENRQNRKYLRYGGRGIRFKFDSPMAMLAYIIGLEGFTRAVKDGLSIDRIDNNGDYAEGNLRWATRKEQAANRRITRFVDLENGRRVTRSRAVNVIHLLTGRDRKLLDNDFRRGKSFAEVLEFAQRVTGEKVDEHEQ